ncbi:MAG: polysaccharide deacetylase family protein [Lysobacter sp.]|nr:polysaccharide deacetylase family protein [Lysobacter sp.]
MLSELARKLLYGSGALGLYHRIRNANSLTVVMFHRILSPDDPRWRSCDPEYTLSTELLAHSLAFFKRHYNVVSLDQVLAARRSGTQLPSRALLITFDDGWADNADFALPELQRAGLPALLFVVADAIGQRQPFFQECIVAAWRRGALKVGELQASLQAHAAVAGLNDGEDIAALRAVIAGIEALEPVVRERVLAPFETVLDDGLRHMVSVQDLQRLQQGGVALGLHGKSHAPMTTVADLDAELGGARAALAAQLGQPGPVAESMSFPHGAHDSSIAQRAHESGYELVFTSVPVLNPAKAELGWLLGRTGFETATVVDKRGQFRPERLALYLFRREHRRLV